MENGEPDAEEHNTLRLDALTDETTWMRQIGHLKDWCRGTETVCVTVPRTVQRGAIVAPGVALLFVFNDLRKLDLSFASTSFVLSQQIVCAAAELLHLTSLRFLGGELPRDKAIDFGLLTSLRSLKSLAVRPHSDEEGLEDAQLLGVGRLTSLVDLDIKASEDVSDAGVASLTALASLTRLVISPQVSTRSMLHRAHPYAPSTA